MRQRALIMLVFGWAMTPLPGHALETQVHDNGITCRPQDGAYFGRFSRSQRGLRNISTQTTRTVYCPITPPTYDSSLANHRIIQVRIFVNAFGLIPTCRIYTMARDGMYHGSDTIGVKGVEKNRADDLYVVARHILFDFGIDSPLENPNGAISIGYSCAMPPDSEIHGAIARMPITRIAGGI